MRTLQCKTAGFLQELLGPIVLEILSSLCMLLVTGQGCKCVLCVFRGGYGSYLWRARKA